MFQNPDIILLHLVLNHLIPFFMELFTFPSTAYNLYFATRRRLFISGFFHHDFFVELFDDSDVVLATCRFTNDGSTMARFCDWFKYILFSLNFLTSMTSRLRPPLFGWWWSPSMVVSCSLVFLLSYEGRWDPERERRKGMEIVFCFLRFKRRGKSWLELRREACSWLWGFSPIFMTFL